MDFVWVLEPSAIMRHTAEDPFLGLHMLPSTMFATTGSENLPPHRAHHAVRLFDVATVYQARLGRLTGPSPAAAGSSEWQRTRPAWQVLEGFFGGAGGLAQWSGRVLRGSGLVVRLSALTEQGFWRFMDFVQAHLGSAGLSQVEPRTLLTLALALGVDASGGPGGQPWSVAQITDVFAA